MAVSANRLELLQIADAVAREKAIDRGIVIAAMEDAIQKAARSRYGSETEVRAEINPKTGEIIGGCCAGPLGGELIHEISAAMAKRMTVRELAAMPHYHPTLAEIWTYPAEELADQI